MIAGSPMSASNAPSRIEEARVSVPSYARFGFAGS
ncbi:unannotated protein [freshwater metagenome]|uniref:Unannotated protein n=1 Tax=freshwater metagenome TaxID=449393 RepID=A0A6J6YF03_9ZZZZ